MDSQTWDPLNIGERADSEIVAAAQKREIKNILKSYVGMYDPFSELIQNSLDAIDKRNDELSENGYEGHLFLTINLIENSFTITDNGIGFNEKEFKSFLAPNISFKDGRRTRGNKGVGATYIGYGFNYLQFGTKGNNHEFVGELTNGRKWVEDSNAVITRPVVHACQASDEVFQLILRGSTFKIKFGGDNTRPKDLSWYKASTPEQWLYLLLLKTPLGSLAYIDELGTNLGRVKFDLKVINTDGSKELINQDAQYIFAHKKIAASVNLKDVIKTQEKLVSEGKDASAIPVKYTKSNGIYEFFNNREVIEIRPRDEEYVELVNKYGIEAYAYFTYSTSVWDQFNDHLAKLRKGFRVLRGGLQLANNRMIQGELISIPLTANIGYQNQCHVIVHFKGADPDLGRKGFQPELKEVAEQIAVAIVNKFKGWKDLLKADTGARPDITKDKEIYDWIKEQEAHEEQSPLSITNSNFFLPTNEISITSTPQSEQDVIVLFNQLLAGGVIRGLRLLSTSQVKQYDGIFKFTIKLPLDNHTFNEDKNPLGVAELKYQSEFTGPPKILEYKYNLDALIQEFENEYKIEKDIELVIAWELGNEWKKNYNVTSLLDLENLHLRDFHGLTHIFHSKTSKFYAIGLKELIDYLNNVEGVQHYQKKTYSDSLFVDSE